MRYKAGLETIRAAVGAATRSQLARRLPVKKHAPAVCTLTLTHSGGKVKSKRGFFWKGLNMNDLIGTRAVSRLLGVKPQRIATAIWDGRIPEPERGPGNAFVWTRADIERACRVLLNRSLDEQLKRMKVVQ